MISQKFNRDKFLSDRGHKADTNDLANLRNIISTSKDVILRMQNGSFVKFRFIEASSITGRPEPSLILTISNPNDDHGQRIFVRRPQNPLHKLALGELLVGIGSASPFSRPNSLPDEDISHALSRFATTSMASEQVSMRSPAL